MTMNNEEIKAAARVLRSGGLLLYPTDTVWGIGCDASNEEAVRKVFALKRRSDSKSLILLAEDMDMIAMYVEQVPEMAVELVNVNDAPMTIIYPGAVVKEPGSPSRLPGLAPSVVAQDGSVGIRIPASSAFCMALLHTFGGPIVSTSANISGEETPRTFSGISEEVKAGVDMVVDPSLEGISSGRSSQIIQLGLDGQVKILRG